MNLLAGRNQLIQYSLTEMNKQIQIFKEISVPS